MGMCMCVQMQTEYTTMKSALAEAQTQAQTMTEEVTVLQQNHDKVAYQYTRTLSPSINISFLCTVVKS